MLSESYRFIWDLTARNRAFFWPQLKKRPKTDILRWHKFQMKHTKCPISSFSMKFSWRNCSYLMYLPPSSVEKDNWATISLQQPWSTQNYPKLASDNFFDVFSYFKKNCPKNVHSMSIIGLHVFRITLNDNHITRDFEKYHFKHAR